MVHYVGRFAPSPTGPLHFGSLVACLASYLDAKAHGGKWLVRIEDVDTTRCKPEHAAHILQTLCAFGFNWDDEIVYQSQRDALYAAALYQLRDHSYACICSRKEIADSVLTGIDGVVYPGTCRNQHTIVEGNAIRITTQDELISFVDIIHGFQSQSLAIDFGDYVIRRRDGLFAYQLAVVVDDAWQNISHVVRGADLLDSTTRQIYLQQLLGFDTPQYLHIPVVLNSQGQKLSKQTLAAEIKSDEAHKLILAALRFLGQDLAAAAETKSPADLLQCATKAWQRARIPKRVNA